MSSQSREPSSALFLLVAQRRRAGHAVRRDDLAAVKERELRGEREATARTLRRKRDALWFVADELAVHALVVGQMIGADRRADVDDRHRRSVGDAFYFRDRRVEVAAKRPFTGQQFAREDNLS